MLQRNGQIPNATILHQMVHSTTTTSRTRSSKRKRTISEVTSTESERELNNTEMISIDILFRLIQSLSRHRLRWISKKTSIDKVKI